MKLRMIFYKIITGRTYDDRFEPCLTYWLAGFLLFVGVIGATVSTESCYVRSNSFGDEFFGDIFEEWFGGMASIIIGWYVGLGQNVST